MKTLKKTLFLAGLVLAFPAFAGAAQALPARIAMLGDSLTYRFDWQASLPGTKAYNFGVDGDTTVDVLARLDSVVGQKPDVVFLQIGINDLGRLSAPYDASPAPSWAMAAQQVFAGHKKIWNVLRVALPDSSLYVCSCLPVSRELDSEFQGINHAVRALNALLEGEAHSQGLVFIDLYSAMNDGEGYLAAAFSVDGIHLSPAGYAVWLERMRAVIGERICSF
ncbi:MAG: hypothetical protein ZNDK_0063 [Candidatus Desulfovibrio kirbyi]|jgi:lysophospholipase L1-like esterase|uniref:SGNH hydrolase-type esterase domain-containing protein n=1 Tax=Candidatus Desulfovibrio kirbyi TaxID=2696086 RepID=A0A6L2R4B3_9BACT|nr:GDSL-type esterase/lipase family protein [Desulfovibrio sp.]GFH62292.1 MAG: hypothetical protein ZNDK_0063 [Candidatus Desulfovibrio kirbyi]